MLASDALDRREAAAGARPPKGGWSPGPSVSRGSWGSEGAPRKAGSIPLGDSLLPPCGHGGHMHRPATIPLGPSGFASRLESTLAEREGQKERRRSQRSTGSSGLALLFLCLQPFARNWRWDPRAPPPGPGGLPWGHFTSQPLWGGSWGDKSFQAKRGLRAEGAREALTRLAERGTPFSAAPCGLLVGTPCGVGSAFSCWSYRSVSLRVLARAMSQGPGHGQISREPDWSGPAAFGRAGRRPREDRKFLESQEVTSERGEGRRLRVSPIEANLSAPGVGET